MGGRRKREGSSHELFTRLANRGVPLKDYGTVKKILAFDAPPSRGHRDHLKRVWGTKHGAKRRIQQRLVDYVKRQAAGEAARGKAVWQPAPVTIQ